MQETLPDDDDDDAIEDSINSGQGDYPTTPERVSLEDLDSDVISEYPSPDLSQINDDEFDEDNIQVKNVLILLVICKVKLN